jgi:hypothetical protein
MKFLQEKYGGGNAFEAKNKYEEFKMQHHTDASKYLDILHGLKVTAKQSGAKIYPRDEFKKLVNDVNPNFYLDYVRNVRMKYNEKLESDDLKNEDIEEIKEYFLAFYNATPKH